MFITDGSSLEKNKSKYTIKQYAISLCYLLTLHKPLKTDSDENNAQYNLRNHVKLQESLTITEIFF